MLLSIEVENQFYEDLLLHDWPPDSRPTLFQEAIVRRYIQKQIYQQILVTGGRRWGKATIRTAIARNQARWAIWLKEERANLREGR